MKNILLLPCVFFINISLLCSEQTNHLELIKKIEYKKIEQTLRDNYIGYLRTHLENYKTTDYTPEKMWNLRKMSQFMTGGECFPYNEVRDEQSNNFIRIAVKKMDLAIVDWHVKKLGVGCLMREDFDYCIGLCIDQLKSKDNTQETQKNSAYNILKTLTLKLGDHAVIYGLRSKVSRERLIKQLILLQLKQKKHQSVFIIEDELITQHFTSGAEDKSPIVVADLYQSVSNKKGNTLSHILVELQDADELYQLTHKDYVSLMPNKIGKTVCDLALDYFQMFTQEPSYFDVMPEIASQARCCLFMLLKYIKGKQDAQEFDTAINCCDKHIIKAAI